MSQVILKGRLTSLEIGVDANTHADVTNLVYARWERVHDIRGAFVSATKIPDHWEQGHSWITFEVALLGYHTAFTTQAIDGSANKAYDEDGDSYPCGYFRLNYLTSAGAAKYTDFNNAIVATQQVRLADTEDVITIVRGLAYYKTDG